MNPDDPPTADELRLMADTLGRMRRKNPPTLTRAGGRTRRLAAVGAEPVGTFHAIHTRDSQALSRHGQPYFATRLVRETPDEAVCEILLLMWSGCSRTYGTST
jgi:hypothetical protein